MTGAVASNSRALRQLRALAPLAQRITVVTQDPSSAKEALGADFEVVGYFDPERSGMRYFWDLHKTISSTIEGLRPTLFHAADLYVLPAVAKAARQTGASLVYDARELYPFVAGTVGKPWATFFWQMLESRYIRKADLVMTVNESIAKRLIAAYGVEAPLVLPNVPPQQEVVPAGDWLRRKFSLMKDTVVLLHQGHLKTGRSCSALVSAMADVDKAALVFLGSGPLLEPLKAQVRRGHLGDRVFFHAPVPYEQLLSITATADVGLTLLEDICLNHRFALPNKLFEYLMAGLPVVGSDLPEISAVINSYKVGITVDPANRPKLVAALRRVVERDYERYEWAGRTSYVFERYEWEGPARRMTSHYALLLDRHKSKETQTPPTPPDADAAEDERK